MANNLKLRENGNELIWAKCNPSHPIRASKGMDTTKTNINIYMDIPEKIFCTRVPR